MSKISELSNGGALLSTDDLIVVRSGGNVRAQLSSIDGVTIGGSTPSAGTFTSVSVDNFTLNGTTLALSSGTMTLDSASDIVLDADGGAIFFKDNGTEIGRLFNSASDLILKSALPDKDMKFQGNDGGSAVNALTLDMSEAGAATFNAGASFGDSVGIGVGVTGLTYRIEAAATSGGNGLKITRGSGSFFEQFMSTTGGVNLAASGSGAFLAFRTGTTPGSSDERMRITSGGLLVGKTVTTQNTAGTQISATTGVRATVDQNVAAILNRTTNDGNIADFRKDGSSVGSISSYGSTIQFGQGNVNLRFDNSSDQVIPANENGTGNDDAVNLGANGARFNDIFATNGTIQTSDRNEKQDIEALSDAEQRVAVAAKSLLRKFRWKSSVEEKGDDARIHFGIIAQDLQDAFTAEGLDAARYGMFCSDTWTDEETGEERTRLGVRYSELLAFIISAI